MSDGQAGALAGRRIVVGVSGSIAAYKAVSLVRLLTDRDAVVDVAMTAAATRFVGPLTFASLTHRPVLDDVFELDADQQIAHIELAEAADAIVLAPATANLIGELAAGLVNDAVTAIACASRAPVIVAPAMDAGMWTHPATQRNVATLREFGYLVVEPGVGELASGLTGIGRLAEPQTILEAVERLFARSGDLEGLHVVVSAGGTREPLDPVRYLGNRSTGRQGYALARSAAARGAHVTVVAANVTLPDPAGVSVVHVETTDELRTAVREHAASADIVVMAAAVADYRPAAAAASKLKKDDAAGLTIDLVQNPDVLAELAAERLRPGQVVVGFAAETGDAAGSVLEHGRAKARRKQADLLVVNAVGAGRGFGDVGNEVVLLDAEGSTVAEAAGSKDEVAHAVWDAVAAHLR